MTLLSGRRVSLRPLVPTDFGQYAEVRKRNGEWLTKWEPARLPGQPDPADSYDAFVARCSARQRERQLGTGFGFGIFVGQQLRRRDQPVVGAAGRLPERLRRLLGGRGARRQRLLPRGGRRRCAATPSRSWRCTALQLSIVPRNRASRRVVEKLGLRDEGVAVRYLQINGRWEDHVRYAITAEEWTARGDDLKRQWL